MNLAAPRLVDPRHLAALGALGVAGLVGLLAGYDPVLAIAAALGLAFVLVALGDLAVGVALFAFLTFLELSPVAGGPAVSFAKLAGLTLAISWMATIAADPNGRRLLFGAHPVLSAVLAFFLSWLALSALWAEDAGVTITTLTRLALNIALFPIVFSAISKPKHMRWTAIALAIGATFTAIYGLVVAPSAANAATSLTAAGELNRISGTVGDPNVLAAVLVVGLVMSLALALDGSRSSVGRMLAWAGALACIAAIFATASRGGLVALAAALIAAVFLAGPLRLRVAGVVSVIAILTVVFFAFFAGEEQRERLTTADGGTGRTDIWKVGWRIVEDRPVIGVGGGNFSVSSIHYLLDQPGVLNRSDFIVDTPAVAHNVYLEFLAELGIPGLTLYLLMVGISLYTATRAARIFDLAEDDTSALIARAVGIALIATLAADFFLSGQFSKQLWLLLGLGPAMLAVATRSLQRGSG